MSAAAATRLSSSVTDPLDVLPAILLVDDETLIRLHVADHIRAHGFRVYEAANADEAMDILAAKPVIDLVFTDVTLPGGMNGFDLGRRIRQMRPELPIVFGSGHARLAMAAAQFGPEAQVFSKPYDLDELIVHFRTVIKSRRAQ